MNKKKRNRGSHPFKKEGQMDTYPYFLLSTEKKRERERGVAVAVNELHSNKKNKKRFSALRVLQRRSPHFAIFECVRK